MYKWQASRGHIDTLTWHTLYSSSDL